jgi:hypothetical protein
MRNWRRRVGLRLSVFRSLFADRSLQVFVGYMSESAEYKLAVRFFPVEIARAADRNRAGVTEYLPEPFRRLYCEGRTFTVDLLPLDMMAVDKIKSQSLETSDSGHIFPRCQRVSGALLPVQRCKARIMSSREIIPASL